MPRDEVFYSDLTYLPNRFRVACWAQFGWEACEAALVAHGVNLFQRRGRKGPRRQELPNARAGRRKQRRCRAFCCEGEEEEVDGDQHEEPGAS
jgi:hypothetical protein